MDGCSSHKDQSVAEFLRKQGVRTIILAPYGYNISTVEGYFAHLKAANINQARLAVGKSK